MQTPDREQFPIEKHPHSFSYLVPVFELLAQLEVTGAEPNGPGTRLSIMADDIEVVGDIFNALAGHLGLSEQSCVSEFPSQIALARQVLGDAKTGSVMATRMQADVADETTGIKTLVRSSSSDFTTPCEVDK